MSWPTEVARFLAHQMGITERRRAEQQWRQGAAVARPGEIWTITVITRDAFRRPAVSWVSGPVDTIASRRYGQIKMLGEEYLPDEARPLSPVTGLVAGKTRWHLERGDRKVPPHLPRAGGDDLAAVPAGTKVMVELRRPSQPELRCIESGTTGHVLHRNGHVGRHIGNSWVLLDNVIGLLRIEHDQGVLPYHQAALMQTTKRPIRITADTGMSADGER